MLSFKKLEKLIMNKGFYINEIFIIDGYITYLDISSLKNIENFILYIPTNYDITIDEHTKNVYKIKNIEIDEHGEFAKNCIEDPDDNDIENNYNKIDLDFKPEYETQNSLEDHLKDNYIRPINLKNHKKDDINQCKYIFNQLSRLKFCVQNLKYKLTILYKNYLCCIKRDDTLSCFMIKGDYKVAENKKLFVTLDLEILFKDNEKKILNDIKTIRESIYKILNNNQTKHNKILIDMILEINKVNLYSENVLTKNKKYSEYINKLQILFENNEKVEEDIIKKIESIKEEYSDPSKNTLHYDIEKSHLISKKEKELDDINNNRNKIIKNITDIKLNKENIILEVDKILFDNIIMINSIINNIQKLSKII